ncbi:MAG: hypothetical protein JSR46_07290 [Verrucomicrobia bacterium]|nr:hypothetical protein [Verrucomicrobiota bacterium]
MQNGSKVSSASSTKKQQQLLSLISSFTQANGFAPTYREIMQMLGLSSVATVHKHIKNLKMKGLLVGDTHKWRAIKSSAGTACATEPGTTSLPLIGSIAKGKKIELSAKISLCTVPETLTPKARTCYGFLVQDNSFAAEHILKGDLLIIEARDTPVVGELVLLTTVDEGAQIERMPTRLDASSHIQGIIIGLVRQMI